MGIEPTRSLFPDPSPVLKTGPSTSYGHAPRRCPPRACDEYTKSHASVLPAILPVRSPKRGNGRWDGKPSSGGKVNTEQQTLGAKPPTSAKSVFTQPRNGRAWDRHSVSERFRAIRKRARVRQSITIYLFRHLWISEMLMAGVDVLLVARMAGTSVAMIERVCGHFRNQSYRDAQARLDRERGDRGYDSGTCKRTNHASRHRGFRGWFARTHDPSPQASALAAGDEERSAGYGSGTVRTGPGTRRAVAGAAGMARRLPAAAAPGCGGTIRR